jgi:hypothetical protein
MFPPGIPGRGERASNRSPHEQSDMRVHYDRSVYVWVAQLNPAYRFALAATKLVEKHLGRPIRHQPAGHDTEAIDRSGGPRGLLLLRSSSGCGLLLDALANPVMRKIVRLNGHRFY